MRLSRYSGIFTSLFVAILTILTLEFACCCVGYAQKIRKLNVLSNSAKIDVSLQKEFYHTIEEGIDCLIQQQRQDGSWSNPDYPALTALATTALLRCPPDIKNQRIKKATEKGLRYLLSCVKPDGGIYKKGLPNYNTAVSMMALMFANNPKYYPVLRKARRFLVSLQLDKGKKGVADEPFDGGVGYGSKDHSDMSNTYFALEAISLTSFLETDVDRKKGYKDLNWSAALKFIQRCQNLPGYNDQPWASADPKNKGGFVYFPGNSKAGTETLPNGRVALRSYGSMTYAGLLSFIYAKLDKGDPRVQAAYKWLLRNYTLEENPGLGAMGLYYYYHTMAKALAVYGEDLLPVNGKLINWRRNLVEKLISLQKPDGCWVNENARWWENDPVLVTSYALISLEIAGNNLVYQLPSKEK